MTLLAILIAARCFAAGPLVVDLDAQADALSDKAFKVGDTNRDKKLNEVEQKKATQEFLRRVMADAKKMGADGLTMAKIAKMINDARPDADADGVVSPEEFREFARDAWTDRIEILMGPRPAVVPPLAPPVIVVQESRDRDDESDLTREMRRRDRQRLLQLEWERRQRELLEQRNDSNNPPVVVTPSGPGRVNSRRDSDDDRSSNNNRDDNSRSERKERSPKADTGRKSDSKSASDTGRTSGRGDKDEKSGGSARGSRSR